MNWSEHLDEFGIALLRRLGENPWYLPTTYNPITRALRERELTFEEEFGDIPGYNRIALARVTVLCQMQVYDYANGPERDGVPQSLRRHWYAYFKGSFAQPMARIFGDTTVNSQGVETYNDLAWTQRLSQVYAGFVETGKITYKDLWVEDASRMMETYYDKLFRGCHIVICVEKDSLLASFTRAAQSLGATVLISGKGKPSKAATEKMLRDAFRWRGPDGWDNPFSAENPLIILTLTDEDYDGNKVIAPSFAEQARRYTEHVLEARIGIRPEQVLDVGQTYWDNAYALKVSNKGYVEWAEEHALFRATCVDCGNQWGVIGLHESKDWPVIPHRCPNCGGNAAVMEVGHDTPHGYEVEALEMVQYRRLIVKALLTVLPFDYIVGKLRDECNANPDDAASGLAEEIYDQSDAYQKLLKLYERIKSEKDAYEQKIQDAIYELAEPHRSDWWDLEDDPTPTQFEQHVEDARGRVWRPFSESARTDELAEYIRKNHDDVLEELEKTQVNLEWLEDWLD